MEPAFFKSMPRQVVARKGLEGDVGGEGVREEHQAEDEWQRAHRRPRQQARTSLS